MVSAAIGTFPLVACAPLLRETSPGFRECVVVFTPSASGIDSQPALASACWTLRLRVTSSSFYCVHLRDIATLAALTTMHRGFASCSAVRRFASNLIQQQPATVPPLYSLAARATIRDVTVRNHAAVLTFPSGAQTHSVMNSAQVQLLAQPLSLSRSLRREHKSPSVSLALVFSRTVHCAIGGTASCTLRDWWELLCNFSWTPAPAE
jgi:hypothetical protein